jgi:hypothetical protein
MKKFLLVLRSLGVVGFLICVLLTFNIFTSECSKNSTITKNILLNKVQHTIIIRKNDNYCWFDLFLEDQFIGQVRSEEKKDNTAKIISLAIEKEFRCKGYGKLILKFVC